MTKITVYVFRPNIFLFKRKMQKNEIPLNSLFEAENLILHNFDGLACKNK